MPSSRVTVMLDQKTFDAVTAYAQTHRRTIANTVKYFFDIGWEQSTGDTKPTHAAPQKPQLKQILNGVEVHLDDIVFED